MTTCKDCIYFEACYQLNSELKKYPKDYLESDICAKQCTTFKDRSDYMDAQKVLDYLASIKGRIFTSSPYDCELYAAIGVIELTLDKYRLEPAKVKEENDGDKEIHRI